MPEMTKKRRTVVLLVYFGLYLGVYQLVLMPLLYTHVSNHLFSLLDVCFDVFVFLLICLTGGKWLQEEFKKFRKQPGKNTVFAVCTVILIDLYSVFMMSVLESRFSLKTAENQSNNIAYMQVNPVGFILNSVILAPFCEEMVFRGSVFAPVHQKHSFWYSALVSGALFGLMHVLSTILSGNWINLLYFLVYGGCGVLLAFPYEGSGTIVSSLLTHSLYNLLGVLAVYLG